jgi:hypothetical protein
VTKELKRHLIKAMQNLSILWNTHNEMHESLVFDIYGQMQDSVTMTEYECTLLKVGKLKFDNAYDKIDETHEYNFALLVCVS